MRLILVIALTLLSACTFKVSESNFIRPQPDPEGASASLGVAGASEHRESLVAAEEGQLNVVSLQQPGAQVTVLYFGPNMFQLSRDGARMAGRLLPLGVDLVMVDHRGSGASIGTPRLDLLEQDALQVHDHVRARLGPDAHLVVHGLSLGSFLAAHVARHRTVAGLVLEGTGTTVDDWARRSVPWFAKPIVRLDIDPGIAGKGTLAAVTAFKGPLLLLAGKRDKEAPWRMARTLFAASATPPEQRALVVLEEAGHQDMLDWPQAIDAYRILLRQSKD